MSSRFGSRMFKPPGEPPVKLARVDDVSGIAECVLIDQQGSIKLRYYPFYILTPMRDALRPVSAWPTTTHVDLIEMDEEERRTKAAKKARRKAALKAKRSNKIRRLRVVTP